MMKSNVRKWLGVIITVLGYYIVHEGAHVLAALFMGTFQYIKIIFPGVQVVADTESMSPFQTAVFSLMGPVSTLVLGYALVLMIRRILKSTNKVIKAVFYYMTLGMLMIDPLYLSVFCGLFDGGDMNGIILFGISEIVGRIIFALIGIIDILVIVKFVFPAYKKSFSQ